jgi:hypothetical protein
MATAASRYPCGSTCTLSKLSRLLVHHTLTRAAGSSHMLQELDTQVQSKGERRWACQGSAAGAPRQPNRVLVYTWPARHAGDMSGRQRQTTMPRNENPPVRQATRTSYEPPLATSMGTITAHP